uniref:cystatin-B-like n=1 Tax=Callithrix jacchus TaxID=9483 RepID=UPI0023DD3B05|nr:cystatin-B-like [Callithrix jacchus]
MVVIIIENQYRPSPLAESLRCRHDDVRAPSAAQPATAETQNMADQVRSQLEENENKKFPVFKAVSFRSQVVAGTNYFIKVHVGDEEFVHLRVFQSLRHENKPLALSNYQTNKAKHDELSYF